MGLQPSMPPLHSRDQLRGVCVDMYVESLAVAVRMNRPLVMKWPNVCIIFILS